MVPPGRYEDDVARPLRRRRGQLRLVCVEFLLTKCGKWCLRCADAPVWCRRPCACERVLVLEFFLHTCMHTCVASTRIAHATASRALTPAAYLGLGLALGLGLDKG